MFNQKELIREEEFIRYLDLLFRFPEMYYSNSISDFQENKHQLKMTSKYHFLRPAKTFRYGCLVYFPNARFKKIKDLSQEDIINIYKRMLEEEGDINDVNKIKELKKKYFEEMKNAVIHDSSGCELRLLAYENFTEGTKIIYPSIYYQKDLEMAILFDHGINNKEKSPFFNLESLFLQSDFT